MPVVGGPSGSGLAKPEGLQKLAARLGIADVVRFRPPVDQEQLADWFRAASVLVMPSYSESFGLVAIEAQAAGTPVLAAAVGGLPVAVGDGRTGFLVPGHDPAAYARVLRDFADERGRCPPGWARRRPGTPSRFGWDTSAAATGGRLHGRDAGPQASRTLAPWLIRRRSSSRSSPRPTWSWESPKPGNYVVKLPGHPQALDDRSRCSSASTPSR